jgi:hypothetical protein
MPVTHAPVLDLPDPRGLRGPHSCRFSRATSCTLLLPQYAWVKNIYSSQIPCSIPLLKGDARVSSCPPREGGAWAIELNSTVLTFTLGIIPQAVRLKARSRAGPLRLVRSQKNYGKRIYENYSIDRSRSTLMVGLKRFTAKSNQNLTQRRY